MRNKSKQRWRRECRPLPSHQTHKPRGGSAPHPNCEGSGPALQSFLKGWAEGDIMLPFHRNLELLQEVSNVTENEAVIPYCSTLGHKPMPLLNPMEHKVHAKPQLHTRTGQTGHIGFLKYLQQRGQRDVSFVLSSAQMPGLSL